jgi:UDPglucose 6-dehydrogenase
VAGLLREVDKINLRRRSRTADLALELAGGDLAGVSVCVLGAAFKPGSDDVRDSPALDVAQILHGMGAQVRVYDPVASASASRVCPELRYPASLEEAATGACVVLLATEWPQFVALTPADLAGLVSEKNIIDARNALRPEKGQARRLASGRPRVWRPWPRRCRCRAPRTRGWPCTQRG